MAAVTPGKTGNEFNLVAQARRQAGSTFKTFVLTQAVADGINPATTTYVSAPFHYQPDPRYPAWDVSTYSHSYSGPITIERATLASDNTVYAQLTLDVGPENVAKMARRMGVQTPLQPVPSIGLGSIAVSPLDMASAYATLAAGGVYSKPMAIRKVVLANGKLDTDVGWGRPERKRVIPDGVAYAVTKILEENMLGGTAVAAYFGRPAAGKTGTTDNHADAWLCGYVPQLEATVWVGYPKGEIPMLSVHGIAVAGGTFPAQIWHQFMSSALRYAPVRDWRPPTTFPVWKTFAPGPYAIQGYTTTSTTTTSTTTTAKTGKKPPRTVPNQNTVPAPTVTPIPTTTPKPTQPPPTVTPIPTTTAPPPPPTTTEPPPPPPTTTEPPPTTAPPPATNGATTP
jgi:penicillin-binding protein 1A